MSPLMHTSDLIACKAGGLIITEALACGLPIMLRDLFDGQETSKARYVVEEGAGALVHNPLEGLETIVTGSQMEASCWHNAARMLNGSGIPRRPTMWLD